MNLRHFFLALFFLLVMNISVVSSENNSLEHASKIAMGNVENTIDSLFILSKQYIGLDNDIALLYIKRGKQFLDTIAYQSGLLNYYLLMARLSYYDDDYDRAILYFDSISANINFEEKTPELAQYYSLNGSVQYCLGNYQDAIEWILRSIEVREVLNDFSGMAMNYNGIGNLFFEQKDLIKAEDNFKKALFFNLKTSDLIGKGNILINFGKVKEQQDSLDIAMNYFTEAHTLFVQNGGLRGIAASLFLISKIQTEWEEYKKAIAGLLEAEEIYLKLDEKYGLTFVYNQISKTYRLFQNYDEALEYATKANALAKQIKSKPLLAESYLQLSEICDVMGQFEKSLVNFKAYETLNKELVSWENNRKLSILENQAKLISQEKNIKILNQENRVKKLLIYLTIICIIILIVVASVIIRIQNLKNKNLNQKKELLEEKNKIFKVENQLHEQNKKILENDLELKNKELASKALALLQLNEALQDVSMKVREFRAGKTETDKNAINAIIQEIKRATHNNIWDEFDLAFNNVHNSFYDKLLECCPTLTSNEIKIAALLKLNLTTKEIAAISIKSESAVKTARHRIRHKLKLEQNENLISFLIKL